MIAGRTATDFGLRILRLRSSQARIPAVSTKLGRIIIDLMVQSSNLSGVTSRSVLNVVLARRYSTNLAMLGSLDHDQLAMAVSPASGADGNSIQARTFKPKALSPYA